VLPGYAELLAHTSAITLVVICDRDSFLPMGLTGLHPWLGWVPAGVGSPTRTFLQQPSGCGD
jgi:hypothetical protein